jgi:phosphoribosylanthranilate isomerase
VVREAGAKSSLIPLFSNLDAILQMLDYYQPDIVHFCEALTNQDSLFETCDALVEIQKRVKESFPEIGIMRSIPIPRPGDAPSFPSLEVARIFEPVSDYFLTDTLLTAASGALPDDQPVSGFVGITGQTCDWDVAAQLVRSSHIPVVLAGGISPDNVSDGIRQTRPAGVDSCTGTNALDENGGAVRFRKDPEKVRHLIEMVRNLESEN